MKDIYFLFEILYKLHSGQKVLTVWSRATWPLGLVFRKAANSKSVVEPSFSLVLCALTTKQVGLEARTVSTMVKRSPSSVTWVN